MMIGFSSAICPGLDCNALFEQAQTLGYDAVEWRGRPDDHGHLSSCSEADTAALAAASKATGVVVGCLASGSSVGDAGRRLRRLHENRIRETVDAASQLSCPLITVGTAVVPAFHNRDPVLARIVDALRSLAPYAAERRVTILVENQGSFATSRDTWYIVDAVGHAAVRCCWNPLNALAAGDLHTLAVPRLARQTAMAHLMDATLGSTGRVEHFVAIGQGQCQLDRYLLLMRGMAAHPHLIVDARNGQHVASPREFLTAAKNWIDAELKHVDQVPELSAYKGDKNAPRFTATVGRATTNA